VVRRGGRFGVYRQARRYYQREGRGKFDVVLDVVNTRPFMCPRFVDDIPVVAVIHQVAREIWSYELPWPMAVLGRYVLEPAWLRAYASVPTLTMSPSSAQALKAYGLTDVRIVPGGLRRPVATAPPRETRPTVIFLGRLTRNKRPDHALEAFRLVSETVSEAQLWVVGTGPLEATLRRTAPPGVRFFGHVDAAARDELLARAHVLISTSVREGWGLVVSEAAAQGTRPVAYDVPGLRDSVSHAGGDLTEADPVALADRVALHLRGAAGWRPSPMAGLLPEWAEVADAVLSHLHVALAKA
jgi:glycosyltransferase involved in cell wall biosynthesis